MADSAKRANMNERAMMNAIAGFLFVLAGDGIILYAFFSDRSGTIGASLTGFCGVIAVFLGIYYMCCYINKRIAVSDDGVDYTNWMGRKTHYEWNQVVAEHRPGRNAKFFFYLDGKKVSFYGYAPGALSVHNYLVEHERYSADTMRQEEQAKELEAERVRQMQRRAQSDASDWDDDEGFDD